VLSVNLVNLAISFSGVNIRPEYTRDIHPKCATNLHL